MATEYRPIPRLAVGVYPLTNVTPFTYRDGVTYERLLHQLIDRMNTIIGEVNTNNQALFDVVIENMNITIDAVNAALGEQTDEVDQKLADLTEYVDVEVAKIVDMRDEMVEYRDETEAFRNQAELFAANTVELQDEAVAHLIGDPESETVSELSARFGRVVILGNDGQKNSDDIAAAFNEMKVSGIPRGELVLRGNRAPIDVPLVFDLGYVNVCQHEWPESDGEVFSLTVEGSLTPAAGIGTAIHVFGGYSARVDVTFKGGGEWGDVGLLVGDLYATEIAVRANHFEGTVLKADATGDITRRIRQSRVSHLEAALCGQALSWSGIEAFGKFDYVWDNGCTHGSVFELCADTAIGHWETYTPASQLYGLDFRNCNSFQVGVITAGDSATGALVRIGEGDFGRINQLRVSGWGTPATITGLLLDNVNSVDIDTLVTFRCDEGLKIVGGGGNGIIIKEHRSLTSDNVPLTVEAGTTSTPRIDVRADYRSMRKEAVKIGAGLTGGSLRLSGYMENALLDGAVNEYVANVDATSGAFVLDVAGLIQRAVSGAGGFTNHPNPANVRGASLARVGNTFESGAAPTSAGLTLSVDWKNTLPVAVVLVIIGSYNATTSDNSILTFSMGESAASMSVVTVGKVALSSTTPPRVEIPTTLIVPPYWYVRVEPSGTGAVLSGTLKYPLS